VNLHEAVAEIKKTFPELRDAMNEQGSLYYNSIGVFATFTQEQINSGNREKLKECFALARNFFMNGDDDLVNAIYVSYLEHLNFDDTKRNHRSYAIAMMPPALYQGYLDIKKN